MMENAKNVRAESNAADKKEQISYRETMINCPVTVYTADFPPDFGKKSHDTTSIPAFFAYVRRKIIDVSGDKQSISVSLAGISGTLFLRDPQVMTETNQVRVWRIKTEEINQIRI